MNITQLIYADHLFHEVVAALREQRTAVKPLPLIVNGLASGGQDAFCVELTRMMGMENAPVLFLAPSESEAEGLCNRLHACGINALRFPKRDLVFYEYSASHAVEHERLFVLSHLLQGRVDAVVTTPHTAAAFTIPPQILTAHIVSISVGDVLAPETLCEKLVNMGYVGTTLVEGVGQFARRGGIVDLWADVQEGPIRVEFFGDEVDRICAFDPESQRVTDGKDSLTILPSHEVMISQEGKTALLRMLEKQMQKTDNVGKEELARSMEALKGDTEMQARDRYLSVIYPEGNTLFDYLPQKTPVVLMGTNETLEAYRTARGLLREGKDMLLERGLTTEKYATWALDEREYLGKLDTFPCLHINAFTGGTFRREGGVFGFRLRRLPSYADTPKAFTDDLCAYLKEKYTTYVVCESKSQVAATVSYCNDLGIPAVAAPQEMTYREGTPGVVYVCDGKLSGGYELLTPRVAVLSLIHDEEAMARRLRPKKRKKHTAGQTILSYAELHVGDYVVHEKYGIGMFEGIESIRQDGATRDFITIRYAGTDKLFIPADRIEAVTKYIGASAEGGVKLSRMGGAAWVKAKKKAQGAAKEMAQELLQLYAERQRKPGISFPLQEELENEFASLFDYELTDPQEAAVKEILTDMEKPIPMDRLLCGDVGFGKTEVALRGAFRAIANGKQVAILVPTTILALQHYQTALSRLRSFAVKVDMLSRFRTGKEQAAILRRLARGETDLVVGTHALLSQQVKFKDLGLLIIDEEQRFGVAQKEKIKTLATNIDVLTLTATPIPRTLNMAMSGIRDMSILDEAPGERRPVETYVLEYNEDVLHTAIRRELGRGGQVLYLYNRTEEIDLVAGRVQQAFPSARVAYAHGQMEKEQIEDIWQALVKGEVDILVCTTIIETGVDLPNANTLIIENADRLGLAQLHQIRGRIGRSSRQAYAYFTYRRGKALSDIAKKRLSAIREYAEFGAGFRIALRDLEIRGAGDLLGASQHGHIESVGYDLYIRLLESAVLEEQGKTPPPQFESTIDIGVDAHIPESYIPSSATRMEMYKKISLIGSEEDRQDVLDEFCDRFGEPPKATQRLLYVALARATAERCRISTIERKGKDICLLPEKPDLAVWSCLMLSCEGFRYPNARSPYLTYPMKQGQDAAKLVADLALAYEKAIQTVKEEQENAESK